MRDHHTVTISVRTTNLVLSDEYPWADVSSGDTKTVGATRQFQWRAEFSSDGIDRPQVNSFQVVESEP